MRKYKRTYKRAGKMSKRRIRGGSAFTRFLSKANKWLRKTGAISKATGFLSKNTGLPYVGAISRASKQLGYGRYRRGGALRLAGQGLSTTGGRKCRKYCRRKR